MSDDFQQLCRQYPRHFTELATLHKHHAQPHIMSTQPVDNCLKVLYTRAIAKDKDAYN